MDEFRDIVGSDSSFKYLEKRAIGKGSFATVWELTENATGRRVVGKFMDTKKMTEKNKNFALGEAKNAAKCHHPNIIQFIESYERNGKVLLIFEYADAGDLYAQINARAPSRYFKENEILLIMAQLLLAMNHLHEQKIMHRDIKSPNIFLTSCGLIKLGDMGFSRQYDEGLSADVGTTFCGTPYYLAPELWNQAPYSKKADIWSIGIVIYELMTLKKPFTGSGMRQLIDRVIAGKYEPLPKHYSAPLVSLCEAMLSVDPKRRPSIHQAFRNDAIKSGLITLLKNVPRLSAVPEDTRKAVVDDIKRVMEVVKQEDPEGESSPDAPSTTK